MSQEMDNQVPENEGLFGIEELALLEAENHHIAANGIVKNHIIASLALGLVPLPLFDIAALTATQMNMIRGLSEHYEVPFDDSNIRSMLTSLIGGAVPVLSVVGLGSVAKIIPGFGTLAGGASVSVLAGAITYATGQVFILHYDEGGTLDDFDVKRAQAFFKQEIESGKAFVTSLKDELAELKNGQAPSSAVQADATEQSDEKQKESEQVASEDTKQQKTAEESLKAAS